jgi:hypothetical protein
MPKIQRIITRANAMAERHFGSSPVGLVDKWFDGEKDYSATLEINLPEPLRLFQDIN